ncbi:oxidoreductase-like protein [Xylogone sp. PMI_703]|nr:oxidoreductase-like protein [Xylogone sp. PMI_703]
MVPNKAIIFKQIPTGLPIPGKDLVVEVREFDLEQEPPAGGIITQNFYASLDPYMRGRMNASSKNSSHNPFTLNEPIGSNTFAMVLKSSSDKFTKGDFLYGIIPHQQYASIPKNLVDTYRKIENPYKLDPYAFLGPLGNPGLTAYASLYDIGKPVRGETIFISAASGAVGQLVGQLAKREGLRVIGSVGSDEKLDFILNDLSFDGGFNYKKEKPANALKRLAPSGVDIYYENVGGEHLEAALDAMNNFGRIVACGMVSQYNTPDPEKYGVKNLLNIVSKRLTIRGFIVSDENMMAYRKERDEKMSEWLRDGSVKAKYSITDGLDNGPEGFVGMLQGKNFGKAILKIADLQSVLE